MIVPKVLIPYFPCIGALHRLPRKRYADSAVSQEQPQSFPGLGVPDVPLKLSRSIVLGLVAATAATTIANAQDANSKISPDAATAPPNSNVQVIVQYYNAPSSQETGLLGLVGGLLKTVLQTINAVVEIVPQTSLHQIAADSNVKYISLDRSIGAKQ